MTTGTGSATLWRDFKALRYYGVVVNLSRALGTEDQDETSDINIDLYCFAIKDQFVISVCFFRYLLHKPFAEP